MDDIPGTTIHGWNKNVCLGDSSGQQAGFIYRLWGLFFCYCTLFHSITFTLYPELINGIYLKLRMQNQQSVHGVSVLCVRTITLLNVLFTFKCLFFIYPSVLNSIFIRVFRI